MSGTGGVTQHFIIMLWTLKHLVTQMVQVQTYLRIPTAVKSWAGVSVTAHLVLPPRTVVEVVTEHKDRQTVTVRALEMGFRAHCVIT